MFLEDTMRRQPSDRNPDSQRPTEAWSRHEHLTPPVQSQAQQLLNEAGSPELARQALEDWRKRLAPRSEARRISMALLSGGDFLHGTNSWPLRSAFLPRRGNCGGLRPSPAKDGSPGPSATGE